MLQQVEAFRSTLNTHSLPHTSFLKSFSSSNSLYVVTMESKMLLCSLS